MEDGLIVLGAGSAAREIYWFIQDAMPGTRAVFVDDATDTRQLEIHGRVFPVVKDWDFSRVPFRRFIVGLTSPAGKQAMVRKALAQGLEPAPPVVTPHAIVRPDCRIGRGGIVAAHSVLTTDVTLGDYVVVFNSTIGSDTCIEDYVTLFAGSHVASRVHLEEGVSIGAASVVREDVRIARGVVAGASCCVTADVREPGITVVGVPARPLAR